MDKINVMIVDDEPACVDTLATLLRDYHTGISIIDTANSMKTALKKIETHKKSIDLLFLDIQMPGGDGFALLQEIPEITFKVIFTTAYDQFALKAIKFSALDYLLKPIDNDELAASISKYAAGNGKDVTASMEHFKAVLTKKNLFEKLAVPMVNEIVFIPVDQIIYFESDNNYTVIHLEGRKSIVSSKNVGYYEELLDDSHFFRIHNSFVINLKKMAKYIKGKAAYAQMENGTTLEIAKRRREDFLRLINLA